MPRNPGGELVEREFLTLAVWDRLDAQTAETVARTVERCLPEPWKFDRVAWHECGDQKRHVAYFVWNKTEFALIPGGEVTLGYDPTRPVPPAELLDGWYEEARLAARHLPEWEGITWERYLSDILSPRRTARVDPLLIAVRGEPKRHLTGIAERKAIGAEGMWLPNSDDWEHACSGGSRALWHWGDDPSGGPPPVNAFGLEIARNTYEQEVLDLPGHYRGGDGGVRVHGGANDLECLVPLSSWFQSRAGNDQEDWWEFTRYRRVFPLPESMFG